MAEPFFAEVVGELLDRASRSRVRSGRRPERRDRQERGRRIRREGSRRNRCERHCPVGRRVVGAARTPPGVAHPAIPEAIEPITEVFDFGNRLGVKPSLALGSSAAKRLQRRDAGERGEASSRRTATETTEFTIEVTPPPGPHRCVSRNRVRDLAEPRPS